MIYYTRWGQNMVRENLRITKRFIHLAKGMFSNPHGIKLQIYHRSEGCRIVGSCAVYGFGWGYRVYSKRWYNHWKNV